ncbi:uncharacterized protein LOC126667193 [Mercurialis annua]|uniref:uncharacterized protein LOC126667193 n=1 Tax=Mercurialis annua TaxID=3986 RepID=UPI00215F88A9|nr:uncharacterized protein LOC126667193 [Mercurialis annua]
MGTKLANGIDVLAPPSTFKKMNCNFQIDSRMPHKNNLDIIKNTMQIQEDIFQHQVRELHRLYNIQKLLMEDLQKKQNNPKTSLNPINSSSEITNSDQFTNRKPNLTTQQTISYYNFNLQNTRDVPSPRERTGSCSGGTMRIITRGFDLEIRPNNRPTEEEISTSISGTVDHDRRTTSSSCRQLIGTKRSNDGACKCSGEESEVELTLSIGGSKCKKSSTYHVQEPLDSPASIKSELSGTPTTPMSSSSTATMFDQDRKQPHWLFQSLSINRSTT